MSTLREILQDGKDRLLAHQIADGALDAWYLMEHVWKIDRSYYFLHADDIINNINECEQYFALIAQRCRHVPLQQLTGEACFFGFPMKVNQHVLIPRQDTEILAEGALERIREGDALLDVCTGSGCLAIALALSKPNLRVDGTDISAEALKLARENAQLNHASIRFFRGDLFEKITGRYQMIISNPPYIRRDVMPTLDEEVRCHEPMLALDGGADGLDFYRRIIREAPDFLLEDGWLGLEIGYDQGQDVLQLLKEEQWTDKALEKDLAGLDRVVWARHSNRRKR